MKIFGCLFMLFCFAGIFEGFFLSHNNAAGMWAVGAGIWCFIAMMVNDV